MNSSNARVTAACLVDSPLTSSAAATSFESSDSFFAMLGASAGLQSLYVRVRDSDRSEGLRGREKQDFIVAGTVEDVDDLDAVVLQAVEDQVIADGTAANAI